MANGISQTKALQIQDGIYAVGAAQKDRAEFHGYSVSRGVTYNAYLLRGNNGKYTLIDTVLNECASQLMERISSVTEPSNIEAVIINHTEPDHSSALPEVLKACNPVIYATAAASKFLCSMYGVCNAQTVKSGDEITVGGRIYKFLATPMVHWPDNMVTYLPSEQILFSNDAFGQHYAASEAIDTLCDLKAALEEATHYFANIVMPYRAPTLKALQAAASLPIKTIAPSHGVIWTKHIPDIINLYTELCGNGQTAATLVFDSMWGGTAQRAKEAADKLNKSYSDIRTFDLRKDPLSNVMASLATSKHVCIGSPTYNGFPTPHISTLVAEIEALKPPVIEYSLFGTFGWGGGASKKLAEKLDSLGLKKTFDLTRA